MTASRSIPFLPAAAAALLLASPIAAFAVTPVRHPEPPPGYADVVARAERMVDDERVRSLVERHGLDLVDVTWEDTGRYDNSSVGPNISDLTIQVQTCREQNCDLHLMPVVRFPNFTDKTGDVDLDTLSVLVGNERGEGLERITLRELLGDPRAHLTDPGSWPGDERSLLAERDTHALVSAQAAFLPIPKGGSAQFNPVLFNYQSYPGNPAVLTIVATREGTSATIIDNGRDGFSAGDTWGQRLFFNENGQRASLTGERVSDFRAGGGERDEGAAREREGAHVDEDGLNMVMVIQVPLVHEAPAYGGAASGEDLVLAAPAMAATAAPLEAAVIGHGESEGPFTEIDGQAIRRDPDFPIRVTVQFYQATETGEVTDADVAKLRAQIDRVYDDADYVGSLVVDGPSGRPTEYDGNHTQPKDWWDRFFGFTVAKGLGWDLDRIRAIWDRLRG
jgi:hypothetical protein